MKPIIDRTIAKITIVAAVVTLAIITIFLIARAEEIHSNESEPAQPQYPYLEYLGTEVIDSNGQEEVNNTYYLHCGGNSYNVTVQITWSDGTTEEITIHSGCDSKWYLTGAVALVEVVGAASSTRIYSVYIPLVFR